MTWTWDEIERDWLLGTPVAAAAPTAVAAFERVEAALGRAWIDAVGVIRGSSPTTRIITLGLQLKSLDGVAGAVEILGKIRAGDASAYSELAALHLVRAGEAAVEVELAPTVRVGEGEKRPDFRLRRPGEQWTHVEVSRPETSELHEQARRVLATLTSRLDTMPGGSSVEVYLRREPAENEVAEIQDRLRTELAADMRPRRVDIAGLCILSLNETAPGQIVPSQYPGEPDLPRLGTATTMGEQQPGGMLTPIKHLSVRIPFTDERAERFVQSEARQLPKDTPGLIILDIAGDPGALPVWAGLINRRFQPTVNTRVGAVCLMWSGHLALAHEGAVDVYETRYLGNRHARFPLPNWIAERLRASEGAIRRASGQAGSAT